MKYSKAMPSNNVKAFVSSTLISSFVVCAGIDAPQVRHLFHI